MPGVHDASTSSRQQALPAPAPGAAPWETWAGGCHTTAATGCRNSTGAPGDLGGRVRRWLPETSSGVPVQAAHLNFPAHRCDAVSCLPHQHLLCVRPAGPGVWTAAGHQHRHTRQPGLASPGGGSIMISTVSGSGAQHSTLFPRGSHSHVCACSVTGLVDWVRSSAAGWC